MKKTLLLPALMTGVLLTGTAQAAPVDIAFELPAVASSQYKRPYVAVWIEVPGERRAVRTLAVWHEDKKWLKDIRRWWRKAGRYGEQVDAVTGATRAPGEYRLRWDGLDDAGNTLSGEVLICLEAVREHGNRTLIKQKVHLDGGATTHNVKAGDELGPVRIQVGE